MNDIDDKHVTDQDRYKDSLNYRRIHYDSDLITGEEPLNRLFTFSAEDGNYLYVFNLIQEILSAEINSGIDEEQRLQLQNVLINIEYNASPITILALNTKPYLLQSFDDNPPSQLDKGLTIDALKPIVLTIPKQQFAIGIMVKLCSVNNPEGFRGYDIHPRVIAEQRDVTSLEHNVTTVRLPEASIQTLGTVLYKLIQE